MERSRATAWGLGVAIAGAIAGCALDRSAITELDAGRGRDAAISLDGGPADAGPRCFEGGCDDGTACTSDRCVPATGCVHDPVTGPCDDGVLCNGADSCGGGSCSVHDGVDPCPGASRCEASVDRCVGCEADVDCPAEMTGDWGACDFSSDVCARDGTRTRSITRYACVAGTCEPSTSTESEACSRSTDGVECMPPAIGDWSDCAYDHTTCSTTGFRTRSVITYVCGGGSCLTMGVGEMDESACGRTTEGTICGEVEVARGPCVFSDACDESGTRTVTTTTPICQSGACGATSTSTDEACTRDTDGTTCGDEVCSDWSMCTSSATGCATTGTSTRTCTAATCSGGACSGGGTGRTESRACTYDPSGDPCTTPRVCGMCRAGGAACPSHMMGTRTCSGPSGTCAPSGTCIPMMITEDCDCP